MRMTAEDTAAYQQRNISVEQLMQNYYPTKLLPKVSKEEYAAGNVLSDGRTVDKLNVYKEHDETRNDYGRYKLYAVVGEQRMTQVMTTADLNAFFDRTVTPAQLVERNFGEKLHLASAYAQYRLPEGVDVKDIRIAKEKSSNAWHISVNMGEQGRTPKKPLTFDDGYSYFKDEECEEAADDDYLYNTEDDITLYAVFEEIYDDEDVDIEDGSYDLEFDDSDIDMSELFEDEEGTESIVG